MGIICLDLIKKQYIDSLRLTTTRKGYKNDTKSVPEYLKFG
uniref:Uncharacterized protein n=1 Tax=Tetranychus urticae TaxID=32264 RepID=T1L664_TETUR